MKLQIFNQSNWNLYKKWYETKGLSLDIYYEPAFLESEAQLIKGEMIVYVAEDMEGNFLLYPFFRLPIPVDGFENYYDTTSPYGYGGPYWSTHDKSFREKSELALCSFMREMNIVNEFVRYHYLYNDDLFFEKSISNQENRKIVLVDVQNGWDQVWKSQFSSTNRNLVSKMEREGFKCFHTCDPDLYWSFIKLYYQTMNNAGASEFYYFSESYFKKLRNILGDSLQLFVVTKGEVLYNAALFFISPDIVTYYLSARNLDFPKVAGNNFLLAKVIQEYSNKGIKFINLGGGSTNEYDNPLFKFKCHFSKNIMNFFIGKRIHMPDVYENIKIAYANIHGQESFHAKSSILQFYR